MKNNKQLIEHMQKFSTYEWLIFIKILENRTEEDLQKIAITKLELFNLHNANWYTLIIDLALRVSNYDNTKVSLNKLPTKKDYKKFIQLYVNCIDSSSNFKNDLNHSLHLAMSKLSYEQLKVYAPLSNALGRLLILYMPIEEKMKNDFGLSPKQIVIFFLFNKSKHDIYEPFSFEIMYNHLQKLDNTIKKNDLKKFFSIFSSTVKQYRLKAKKLGITKNTIKAKRLIDTFPILDLENNYYFIPSINILEESLSYKIFETLENIQKKSQVFRTKFGATFEEYIRKLTFFSHSDYFYECSKLITQKDNKKAEFYLLKNDTVLVIEAKLLYIDDEIILHQSAQKLESKFEKIIKKALIQINSCFDNIEAKNKYGIIVIHTHLPMLDSFLQAFKSVKNKNIDNIMLMSVIDYEVMIHNEFQNIIEYFQERDEDKKQVALYFKQQNPCLIQSIDLLIEDLTNNHLNKKDFQKDKS